MRDETASVEIQMTLWPLEPESAVSNTGARFDLRQVFVHEFLCGYGYWSTVELAELLLLDKSLLSGMQVNQALYEVQHRVLTSRVEISPNHFRETFPDRLHDMLLPMDKLAQRKHLEIVRDFDFETDEPQLIPRNKAISYLLSLGVPESAFPRDLLNELEKSRRTKNKLPTSNTPNPIAPSGTQWHQVRIKFSDGDTVTIHLPGPTKTLRMTSAELGMATKNSKRANREWKLLERFAEARNNQIDKNSLLNQRVAFDAARQQLNKSLKKLFGIEGDAIALTKDKAHWKTCFRVEPESNF